MTAAQATPNAFSFTNTDGSGGSAAVLSIGNGSNQATQVNTTFPTALSVGVFNGSGGPASGIDVVFSAPTSSASGSFAGGTQQVTVTTGGSGLATAPAFTANGTPGQYTVTVSVDGTQTVNGTPLTNAFGLRNTLNDPNGVPETLSLAAGGGQVADPGATFGTNLQVVVLDGAGAYVQGAEVVFSAPTGAVAGGTFGGAPTFTTTSGVNGLATAASLTANLVGGPWSVHVSASLNGVEAETTIGLTNRPIATTTTLTATPTPSTRGERVDLSATVAPVAGPLQPAAPVEFRSGDDPIDGCESVLPLAGVATCSTTALPAGTMTLTAAYSGDAAGLASTSDPVEHTVAEAELLGVGIAVEPTFSVV